VVSPRIPSWGVVNISRDSQQGARRRARDNHLHLGLRSLQGAGPVPATWGSTFTAQLLPNI